MGVFSNKIDRSKLKPGDHIYSWRRGYTYAHHGIYISDRKVIHFTRASGQPIVHSSYPSHPVDTPCPTCGHHAAKLDGVVCSCIDCFLSGGKLYIYKYGVSHVIFFAKTRGGTCTLASSDPSDVVLHRSSFLLERGFGDYNLFKNNCEDFAVYCKTGVIEGRSGQVVSLFAAVLSNFMICCCPCVGCNIYCGTRLACDVSTRYMKKTDVEYLVDR